MKLTIEYLINLMHVLGYKPAKNSRNIDFLVLAEAIINKANVNEYIRTQCNCSKQTVTTFLAKSFPDRIPTKNSKILIFLLDKTEYKFCPNCDNILLKKDFNKNAHNPDGLGNQCRICAGISRVESYINNPGPEKARNKLREEIVNIRTPSWACLESIEQIYINCPEGYHVDHEIPLQGKLVSGLHVEGNLQYLTAKDNLAKGNKFLV